MSYGSTPPPPPPNYGGPSYGVQQPYGGAAPSTSGKAIASLVLGIISLLLAGCLIWEILAIVFGVQAKREIRESGGTKTGFGMAQAGFILGIIAIALAVLSWILVGAGVISFHTSSN